MKKAEQKALKRRKRQFHTDNDGDNQVKKLKQLTNNSQVFLQFLTFIEKPVRPPSTKCGLLSSEDLQRIENIQFLYQKRIELGSSFTRNSRKIRRNCKKTTLFFSSRRFTLESGDIRDDISSEIE